MRDYNMPTDRLKRNFYEIYIQTFINPAIHQTMRRLLDSDIELDFPVKPSIMNAFEVDADVTPHLRMHNRKEASTLYVICPSDFDAKHNSGSQWPDGREIKVWEQGAREKSVTQTIKYFTNFIPWQHLAYVPQSPAVCYFIPRRCSRRLSVEMDLTNLKGSHGSKLQVFILEGNDVAGISHDSLLTEVHGKFSGLAALKIGLGRLCKRVATRIHREKLKQLHAEFFSLPPMKTKGFPGGTDYWKASGDFHKRCEKHVKLDEPRIIE